MSGRGCAFAEISSAGGASTFVSPDAVPVQRAEVETFLADRDGGGNPLPGWNLHFVISIIFYSLRVEWHLVKLFRQA
jgi:hypothetical protein